MLEVQTFEALRSRTSIHIHLNTIACETVGLVIVAVSLRAKAVLS